jgi:hypothetical protein
MSSPANQAPIPPENESTHQSQRELIQNASDSKPHQLEPIDDGLRILTSDELRKISETCRPPNAWFEGEEEQLF